MASIVSDSDWLRKNIEDGSIRFYSFTDFIDPVCIGAGAYGVVFKAKAKTLSRTIAYKLLLSQNEDVIFENFVKELKIHRKVDDHLNIIRFLGVSQDSENKYAMVFEYADGGSLRRYLSDTAVELDWLMRCKLGINIIDGLRYLHELDILHKDLSSQNILVHAGVAKITDFGLSDLILQQKSVSNVQGTLPYLDPRCLYDTSTKRDEKSDIFSFGVVLWEISGGKSPCDGLQNYNDVVLYRLNGSRDAPISGTPEEYVKLYSACWDDMAEKRPSCEQIFESLNMIAQLTIASDHPLSDTLSRKYYEELLKGKREYQIVDVIKNWLAHNEWYQQDHSPVKKLKDHIDCGQCFWLLGLFYEYGITVTKNINQAAYWYELSAGKNNAFGQTEFGLCYYYGSGVEKDFIKAVELCQKAAEQGYVKAQIQLGYFYHYGIGIEKDYMKTVELYQRAAEQGCVSGWNELGYCYQNGVGVKKDVMMAVELYQKAAEQGEAAAQRNLGYCYRNEDATILTRVCISRNFRINLSLARFKPAKRQYNIE